MLEYRLYCLDEDGDCTREHLLGAAHDSDAIAQIEVMQVQSKCELWSAFASLWSCQLTDCKSAMGRKLP